MELNSYKLRLWLVLNALAYASMVTVNGLANALPINGVTTGEVSDMYPNLFTPAGLTFSIWGVIYLWLLVFIVFQASRSWNGAQVAFIVGPLFCLSSVANMVWIVAWHFQLILLSWLLMLLLLASLAMLYLKLRSTWKEPTSVQKWFLFAPFSIYLAWISIATIANTTILLQDLGWDGFGVDPSAWTVIVILAGVLITYQILRSKRDLLYACVTLWALFGIVMKRVEMGSGWPETVFVGALAGIACVASVMIYFAAKSQRMSN